MWITPITDRTLLDAQKAKEYWNRGFDNLTESEKAEFMAGLKGSLNTQDLERIQGNIKIISDQLLLGLTVSAVPEFPNEFFFEEILFNISSIRNKYGTTTVPSVPINTYEKVNQIEELLKEVHDILINRFIYCGTGYYCGEDMLL